MSSPSRSARFLTVALVVLLAFYAAYRARQRAWVCDDSFISFRYAENLVAQAPDPSVPPDSSFRRGTPVVPHVGRLSAATRASLPRTRNRAPSGDRPTRRNTRRSRSVNQR